MDRVRSGRGALGVAAACIAVLVASGCASTATGGPTPGSTAALEAAGPWADDFGAALADNVSPFEARILADGAVSSEEVEAAHDRVGRCLADSGFGIDYDPDGGFELQSLDDRYPDDFFERSDPVLRSCERKSDEYVTYLFSETRRNPDRLDEATITVPCLRDTGLVGSEYTEQRWRSDYEAGSFPFDETADAAVQCRLDPLGLWRTP